MNSFRAGEKRRHIRFPVEMPVHVIPAPSLLASKEQRGMVLNLSAGGLMFDAPGPIRAGSRVRLILDTTQGPVTLEGRIVWVRHVKDGVHHGVEFVDEQSRGFATGLFSSEYRR